MAAHGNCAESRSVSGFQGPLSGDGGLIVAAFGRA